MDLQIRMIEGFFGAQRGTFASASATLSLNVRGARSYRCPGFDRANPGPFLILLPPQVPVTCDHGPERENWAVLFESSDLRPGSKSPLVAVRAASHEPWTELPLVTELPPSDVPALLQQLVVLRSAFRSPLAIDRYRVHAGIMSVIARCLAGAVEPSSRDPAAHLRRLLDDDAKAAASIATLSRLCGMNIDHLRERFERAYGLTPLAYRQGKRLGEAMRLLASTDSPVQAIARQLGFSSVSHFCARFRAHFGQTPLHARSRARFGA
jgi:AraC-like DNA-binding protein